MSITLNDFRLVTAALRATLRGSPKLLAEFDRADPARAATHEASKAYLLLQPAPHAPESFTTDGFDHLVGHVGPDVWRMRCVDQRFASNHMVVLPLGGSCAIETWGMRIIEGVRQREPDRLAEVADRILAMGPTFTHATGAMLTGAPISVHFRETGLWAQRLAEWGVDGAIDKTHTAYDGIQAAVERRARLVNPDATVLGIDFNELALREGPIERWFADMDFPYDPSFGIAEVLYTYTGPELFNLVMGRIRDRVNPAALARFTHVARLKQVDHCDWESAVDALGKKAILNGGNLPDDATYPLRAGVRVGRWIREQWGNTPSLVSGFFDTPFDNQPLHMVPYLPGGPSVDDQLGNPMRLHAGNVDAHLVWLETYLEERMEGDYAVRAVELTDRRRERQELTRKITKHRERVPMLEGRHVVAEIQVLILRGLLEGRLPMRGEAVHEETRTALQTSVAAKRQKVDCTDLSYTMLPVIEVHLGADVAKNPILRAELALRDLLRRLTRMRESIGKKEEKDMRDESDLDQIAALLTDIEEKPAALEPGRWRELGQTLLKETESELLNLRDRLAAIPTELAELDRTLAAFDVESTAHKVTPASTTPPGSILPLHKNLFVAYATQFLFDPDFRAFMSAVHVIEEWYESLEGDQQTAARQEHVRLIRVECRRIYPKLAAYLRYVLQGGAMPSERMERFYT